MKLGTRDKETSSYDGIIRIRDYDRPYRLKILDGPYPQRSIFYKTKAQNDAGEEEVRTAVITVSSHKENVLSPLVKIHKETLINNIYERLGNSQEAADKAKKVSSSFEPRTSYHCLVLDKADSVPTVRRAEFPWSVRSELLRLEGESNTDEQGNKDETTLRYGLMIMLWYEITRIYKNPEKKDILPVMTNTAYRVSVLEEFSKRFSGKIPKVWQSADIQAQDNILTIKPKGSDEEIKMDVIKYGLFTEDGWSAVKAYEPSLEELVQPMTNEEAMEKLRNEPILLDATNKDGTFIYPSWKDLLKVIEERNIDFPLLVQSTTAISSPVPEALPEKKVEEPVKVEEPPVAEAPAPEATEPPLDTPESESESEEKPKDLLSELGLNGKEWDAPV